MTRLRLVLLLVALAFVGIATPAQAGLLDSLLGSSSDGDRSSSVEGTTASCRPTAIPVLNLGLGSCSGVRPGALIDVDRPSSAVGGDSGKCTLNFLFDGSDGERYIGTAGHCALGTSPLQESNGEKIFDEGEGPEVRDSDGVRIGEFAYAIQEDPKDFGLIRLDDGVEADPQVPQVGGPTGVNDEITSGLSPTNLFLYGNPGGLGGPLATGRTLFASGLPDPDKVQATGFTLPGDSGGPVLDEQGRAVGVLVEFGVPAGLLSLDSIGLVGITRLTPQLEQAERALGVDMTLQTAPQL